MGLFDDIVKADDERLALPEHAPDLVTFYFPADRETTRKAGLSYSMEGGVQGGGSFGDIDLRNHTFEKYKQGESDFVAVAMPGVPSGKRFRMNLAGEEIIARNIDTGGGLRPGQVDIATGDPEKARGIALRGDEIRARMAMPSGAAIAGEVPTRAAVEAAGTAKEVPSSGAFGDIIAADEAAAAQIETPAAPQGVSTFNDLVDDEDVQQRPVSIPDKVKASPTPEVLPTPEQKKSTGEVDWPTKTLRAVEKYAREMIPQSGGQVAQMAGIPSDLTDPMQLLGLVAPQTRPFIQIAQQTENRAAQIQNADMTPPYSQERFDAGVGTALDLLGVAATGKGVRAMAERGGVAASTPDAPSTAQPQPPLPPPPGTAGAAPPPLPVQPQVNVAQAQPMPAAPIQILTAAEREAIKYSGDKSTGLTPDDLKAIDEIETNAPQQDPSVGLPTGIKSEYRTDKASVQVSPKGYIRDLFVKPEARRSGEGTRLMNQVISDADKSGTTLSLHIGEKRTDLPAFYEKLGFKRTGQDQFGILFQREPQPPPPTVPPTAPTVPEPAPSAPRRPTEKAVTMKVRPLQQLRRQLSAAERAGEVGFRRGTREGKAQAEEAAKIEARMVKDTVATVDEWMAADVEDVRKILLSFSRHLPLHERGKFIPAISKAIRKPKIFSRDPGVIQRRAASLMDRMTEAIYKQNKKELSSKVNKLFDKIADSPSIVLSQKRVVAQMQKLFNNLKDKMSLDMLERMHDWAKWKEALGRDLFSSNKTIEEVIRPDIALNEIEAQGTRKANDAQQALLPLGDVETWWQKQTAKLAKVPAAIARFNAAITPMDWVFQAFDQRQFGKLWEHMKAPIDIQYGQFLDTAHVYKKRLTDLLNKHKLDDGQLRRIYAHAEYRQAGGEANLKAMGYSAKDIGTIKNVGQLSKAERAYLREADAINREMFPAIKQVLEDFYNQDISSPDGYFPRIRDWDHYNSLSIEQGKFADAYGRTNVRDGFTKERQGAVTKNIGNAHEVMMQHIDDAAYHMTMGPTIKRMAKIVGDDRFKGMTGNFGQRLFADWVDVLARNGGTGSGRRIGWMDTLRKNTGVAQLAFRFTTTFLQPTSLIQAMPYLGKANLARTLSDFGNPANREWILKNFPEVKHRLTDDPAAMGYTAKTIRDKAARAGFGLIGWFDRAAAMTVAETAYRDALAKRGLTFDRSNAIHMQAYAEAMNIVRKTQASPFTKDIPMALSGGKFAGNKSLNQAVFQFQNFTMNRWAMMKGDALQMGIKDKSPKQAARVMAYLVVATTVEQMLREGIANALRATLGVTENEENKMASESESVAQRIMERGATDLALTMPIVSNLAGVYRYDSSGVPIADTLLDVVKGARSFVRGAKPETKAAGAIRAAQGVGGAFGLPTGQAGDLLSRLIRGTANAQDNPVEGYYPLAPPPTPPPPP